MAKGAAADKEDCHSPLSSSSSATDLTLESSYDIISRVSDDDLSVISDGYDEEHYVLSESASSLDLDDNDYYGNDAKERSPPPTPSTTSGNGYGILETPDLSMVSLSGSNNTLRMPLMMDSSSSSFCVGDSSEKTRSLIYRGVDYDQAEQRVLRLAPTEVTSSRLGFLPWINLIGFGRSRDSVKELMSHYMEVGKDEDNSSRYNCFYCYFADSKACELTVESVATGKVHGFEQLNLDGCTVALVQLSDGSLEQGFCLADVYSVLKKHDIPAVTVADTPIYLHQFATHRFLFSSNAPISVSHEPGNTASILFSPLIPSQFHRHLQFEDFERILLDGGHPVPAPQLIQRTDLTVLSFHKSFFRKGRVLTLLSIYLVLFVIAPYVIVRSKPDSPFARLFTTNNSVTNIAVYSTATSVTQTVTSMANNNIITASGVNSNLKALATAGEKSIIVLRVEETQDGPQVVAYRNDAPQMAISAQQLKDLGLSELYYEFVRQVRKGYIRQTAVQVWKELMSITELFVFTMVNAAKDFKQTADYYIKLAQPHVTEVGDTLLEHYSKLRQSAQTLKDVQIPEARERAKEHAAKMSRSMNEQSLWAQEKLSQLTDHSTHQMLKWKQDAGDFVSQLYSRHFKTSDDPAITRARKRSHHITSRAKSVFDAKKSKAKDDFSSLYSKLFSRPQHRHHKHHKLHTNSNCRARFWPL